MNLWFSIPCLGIVNLSFELVTVAKHWAGVFTKLLSSICSCHPHAALTVTWVITTSSGPFIVTQKVGLLLSQVCITPQSQAGCLTCHPTLQKFHFAQSIGAPASYFYCRGNFVSPAVESLQPTPKPNRFYPLTSSFRWFVSLLSCKGPSVTLCRSPLMTSPHTENHPALCLLPCFYPGENFPVCPVTASFLRSLHSSKHFFPHSSLLSWARGLFSAPLLITPSPF